MESEHDFREFINARQWIFAKTMPHWPHEYTVRQFQGSAGKQAEFEQAVAFIRGHGQQRIFEPTGRASVYLDIDGRQYWTMGAPIEKTVIINRAWLDWRERLARGEKAESGKV